MYETCKACNAQLTKLSLIIDEELCLICLDEVNKALNEMDEEDRKRGNKK